MWYVQIYKLQNDGSQTVLATAHLSGDIVTFEGDQKFIDFVTNEGIQNYSDDSGKKLFPKDGILFLEQLQYNFKSGYLNASEVKER
ncbi:MAG: hypothetical protein NTZ13_03405 [Candidatus Parcubacteria bacterium]|nr:hypothetical protein [Candidatus Parcubacteria bacterium]